jgi:hypothetical protein
MNIPLSEDRSRPHLSVVGAVRSNGGFRQLAPPGGASDGVLPASMRATYVRLLTWAFTFFNSVRILAYMPTIWTLAHSGDSSQHSLWTWGTWFCANVTMSLWLIERNGSRLDGAAMVNIGNALMCLAVIGLIVIARV